MAGVTSRSTIPGATEERHGEVREEGAGEGQEGHARAQGGQARKRQLAQKGEEPQAGDRDRSFRSAARRREGTAESESLIEEIGREEVIEEEVGGEEIRAEEVDREEVGSQEVVEESGREEVIEEVVVGEEGIEEVRLAAAARQRRHPQSAADRAARARHWRTPVAMRVAAHS
jgi:hypothetical protein